MRRFEECGHTLAKNQQLNKGIHKLFLVGVNIRNRGNSSKRGKTDAKLKLRRKRLIVVSIPAFIWDITNAHPISKNYCEGD